MGRTVTCIVLVIMLVSNLLYSQVVDTVVKFNKIIVPKGYYLTIGNRLVHSPNDTMVFIPVETDFTIRKTTKYDSVYNKLSDKASRKKWTQSLHNIILVSTNKISKKENEYNEGFSEFFYENVKIRKIQIARHDVFGPFFLDSGQYDFTFTERLGNRVHIKTREAIIKNYLQFKEGDEINSFLMFETERILREASFIQEAKIILNNFSPNNDSADVIVLIRDAWSIGADLMVDELNQGKLEVWDNNLVGLGNTNSNTYTWDPDKKPSRSIYGYLRTDNIAGSFVNLKMNYSLLGNKQNSITIWRDFYTASTKFAGMFSYEQFDGTIKWLPLGSMPYYTSLAYNKFDIWIGRSFQINTRNENQFSKSNIAMSIGYIHDDIYQKPNLIPQTYYRYQDKRLYLSSLGISQQGFSKMNLVYSFGRTEDIPYGVLLNFTQGFEYNEFNSRNYYSARLSAGNFVKNIGYIYTSAATGSFIRNNRFEQGIMTFDVNAFTNLLVLGQYKTRFFFNVQYTKGLARFNDENLTLRDQYGIRGFSSDSVFGDQKLRINIENVIFTPFYLAHFRFAFFQFFDCGFVGNPVDWIFKNQLYTGFGLGVRVRNERLVIKTFQLRLSFYPFLPYKDNNLLFQVRSESRYRPSDFFIRRPEIIGYR